MSYHDGPAGPHDHKWGKGYMTTTFVRPCTVEGCRVVSADNPDDDDTPESD